MMNKIKDNELKCIIGGAITGTMINAIARGITSIYNVGRALGSALRRAISGKYCSL